MDTFKAIPVPLTHSCPTPTCQSSSVRSCPCLLPPAPLPEVTDIVSQQMSEGPSSLRLSPLRIYATFTCSSICCWALASTSWLL